MSCWKILSQQADIMNEEKNFDEKFDKLDEYYNIKSPIEVRKFLEKNSGIFVLLDKVKPYLEETFEGEKYCLEMVYDPECCDCDQLVLNIYVSKNRFHNGVRQDIEYVRKHMRPFRRQMQVLSEFAIRADVGYV